MKANARHVPGSTRSYRAPLSRSFPFFLPSLLNLKNPSKIRPKADHFHRCEFFNGYIPTTYNFDPLKRSDFSGALGLLAADNQRLATESHDARLRRLVACYPFSLVEKVRMRGKPVHLGAMRPAWQQNYKHCTKRYKMGHFPIRKKTDSVVPTTYDDTSRACPIFNFVADEVTSLTLKESAVATQAHLRSASLRFLASFAAPLGIGTSVELGTRDLDFHKMSHFERKKWWGVRHFSAPNENGRLGPWDFIIHLFLTARAVANQLTIMSTTEKHHFQAEIQQLLDIVIHSLYTDKEIFVRELISNAADACEKLRFLQSSGQPVFEPETPLGISIKTDEKESTVTFIDTGIGMTQGEMIEKGTTVRIIGSSAGASVVEVA